MEGFQRFPEKTWTALRIIKKSISMDAMISYLRNSLGGNERSGGLESHRSEIWVPKLTVKGSFNHLKSRVGH